MTLATSLDHDARATAILRDEHALSDEEQRRLARAFQAVEEEVAGPGAHARFLSGVAEPEGA